MAPQSSQPQVSGTMVYNNFVLHTLAFTLSYGEQVLVLLQSIAKCGGLDCCQYAASFAQAFQDTNGGYRDVSAKVSKRIWSLNV
eukprot:1160797-Pelagomonas_calceolata.AAC.4